MEPKYVDDIDQQIGANEASADLKALVADVQSFHGMRQHLCGRVIQHLHNHPVLHELIAAGRVEQHDTVAHKSLCTFTNQTMAQHQGMTLIISGRKPHIVTINKRFKRLVYSFWYLVHFADEIMKEIRVWLSQQRWWRRGTCPDVTDRILQHQEYMFAKQAYVKLKGINQYIQQEMVSVPINK